MIIFVAYEFFFNLLYLKCIIQFISQFTVIMFSIFNKKKQTAKEKEPEKELWESNSQTVIFSFKIEKY